MVSETAVLTFDQMVHLYADPGNRTSFRRRKNYQRFEPKLTTQQDLKKNLSIYSALEMFVF